jgi:hypothetical protein
MATQAAALTKATVVRGTFMKITDTGERVPVLPGLGKDSDVDVTESVLAASVGVLVRAGSQAEAEVQRAAAESMAPATQTNQAIVPPTQAGQAAAGAAAAAGQRRTR